MWRDAAGSPAATRQQWKDLPLGWLRLEAVPLERAYAIIALTFGVMYMFIIPPFEVSDEFVHYWRSYHISEGHLVPEIEGITAGGALPNSVIAATDRGWQKTRAYVPYTAHELWDNLFVALDTSHRTFQKFYGAAPYNPVPYLPQSAAMAVARWLDAAPVVLMYVGRLVNLLLGVFLVFLSLRLTPILAPAFFLVALLPTTLCRTVSLSADSLLFGGCFLFVALVLRQLYRPHEPTSGRTYLALGATAALIGACKPGYFLVPLFAAALPLATSSPNRRGATVKIAVVGLLGIGVMLAWNAGFGVHLAEEGHRIREKHGLTYGAQLQIDYVLANPLRFVPVLAQTAWTQTRYYVATFVANLGRGFIPLVGFWSYAVLAAIGVAVLSEDAGRPPPPRRVRALAASIVAASALLIAAVLYASYNAVAAPVILGLDGRYFTPLAPLALVALRGEPRLAVPKGAFVYFSAVLLLVALVLIAVRFY